MRGQVLRTFARGLFFFFVFPALSSASGNFSVITFNAYGPAYAPSTSERSRNLVDELNREPASEVLLLQEVWSQGHQDILARGLGDAGGRTSVRFDAIRNDGKKTGLSTFSRLPVRASGAWLFPVNNQWGLDSARDLLGIEKGIGWIDAVLTEASDGPRVRFFSLHTHPSEHAVRVAQMIFLVQKLLEPEIFFDAFVVGGDFNATPDSLEVALLQDVLLLSNAWTSANGAYSQGDCTYCRENSLQLGGPDRVIDYLFTRSGDQVGLSTLQSEVVLRRSQGRPLSDHYGVQARLSWKIESSQPISGNELDQRLRRARASLREAKFLFISRNEGQYEDSIASIERLEARFENRDPELLRYFSRP